MHGRLLVKWLGFVNSCGRSCFLEEIVIVVPRWFGRASRYRFLTVFWMRLAVLGTTVSQIQFALFSSVTRSCPHANALPVNWSSPKSGKNSGKKKWEKKWEKSGKKSGEKKVGKKCGKMWKNVENTGKNVEKKWETKVQKKVKKVEKSGKKWKKVEKSGKKWKQ